MKFLKRNLPIQSIQEVQSKGAGTYEKKEEMVSFFKKKTVKKKLIKKTYPIIQEYPSESKSIPAKKRRNGLVNRSLIKKMKVSKYVTLKLT